MNYLNTARRMFLDAAQNLQALSDGHLNLLEGLATRLSGGRRTKLKPGFNAIANSFAICITQTADVLIGNTDSGALVIEAEGCDWLTLESDVELREAAEVIVLEAELQADFAQMCDVFMRIFDEDGNPTDLPSQAWEVRADGLCTHMLQIPEAAQTASRCRLILHMRQPIGQITIQRLGLYII